MQLLVASLCLTCLVGSYGRLSGMFVLPHGGIAISPDSFETNRTAAKELAHAIYAACSHVGDIIAQQSPDIVLLITPHGIADHRNFVVYQNLAAAGFADTDHCECSGGCCFNVTVKVNAGAAQGLLQHLMMLGHNAPGLSAFGPPGIASAAFPLRWGEVIPTYFTSKACATQYVFISLPYRRYQGAAAMLPEAIQLGADIQVYIDKLPQHVVLVVSADLAHTHDADGPYGFSEDAQKFDDAVASWIQTQQVKHLTVTAAGYESSAMSCGLLGFGVLQGFLQASSQGAWLSELLVVGHPSYYGMLVAAYTQQQIYTTA